MNDYKMSWEERVKTKPGYKLVAIVFIIILAAYSSSYVAPIVKNTHKELDCRECHSRKIEMIKYFRKAKNPHPEELAVAVLATNSPRLLAAIAVKGERNTPYTVRRGGLGKRHSGSWQFSKNNTKAYGPVPFNPTGQALQAERLLNDLANEQPTIIHALNAYGGESNKAQGKYAYNVLKEFQNVP